VSTGGVAPIPRAEVEVTDDLVAALIESQHTDLAGLELRRVASGWDNVIYRLGDDLSVRLPRRQVAVVLVENEQRWLPELARRLPLPIPTPVRIGRPGLGYPWPWSITPWFDGVVAAETTFADSTREARRLGAFMSALHVAAPPDAPSNPFRDGFIGDRTERYSEALDRVAGVLDEIVPSGAARARQRWAALIATRRFAEPPTWVAGDVHAANLVVADGAISAVIDFGDLCAGDPAVDLAVGWMLFDEGDRAVFREAAAQGSVAVDDPMWRRAEAWALYFAVVYLANSADDERLARMGRSLAGTLLT
jgi:aminoglycoside phosphotransferase (APT) family kinase protein